MTPTLGLISDTHGLLREAALLALQGCELIVHAGDVGARDIVLALERIAPVVAIRGNTDTKGWAAALPETATAELEDARIYVLHSLHDLDLDPEAAGFNLVVSGHSHQPKQEQRGPVLYVNPGSAGPRRFKLPVTIARIELRDPQWKITFVDCGGEGAR
ncbi:MAG TPA: metallophosphoesterase family protein [Bryobacteraceae bacterium]|nr:metallophosphoesterase family protein [Bryobacteraceae bacterium]